MRGLDRPARPEENRPITTTTPGNQEAVEAWDGVLFDRFSYFRDIVVGGLNLVVWLGNSDAAPDMVGTFALGALGWLAGAFASVFSAD